MAMRGAKWMREATHLTEDDREKILHQVDVARRVMMRMGDRDSACTVGVQAAAYIGEPHPIAAITYGRGGGSLWDVVYR